MRNKNEDHIVYILMTMVYLDVVSTNFLIVDLPGTYTNFFFSELVMFSFS